MQDSFSEKNKKELIEVSFDTKKEKDFTDSCFV